MQGNDKAPLRRCAKSCVERVKAVAQKGYLHITNGWFRKTLSLKRFFLKKKHVCPNAAAGTDVLEDCHIRQAERAGTKMKARRGKIAIENGWLDSRQLARRACQMLVCMNELSDGTACSKIT